MRNRRIGALLLFLGLLWLLYVTLSLDPVRTGLALLLLAGGYWLARSGARGVRGRFTGVVHLMDREHKLEGFDLSCAIADVKIDLSRAIIPAGEHLIRIDGLVGNVDIYVPYDLAVSVNASVRAGALNVMRTERGGAGPGPAGVFETAGYGEAVSKVKIAVTLLVGDVNVRYL
jgi:lia operon protein LiaF